MIKVLTLVSHEDFQRSAGCHRHVFHHKLWRRNMLWTSGPWRVYTEDNPRTSWHSLTCSAASHAFFNTTKQRSTCVSSRSWYQIGLIIGRPRAGIRTIREASPIARWFILENAIKMDDLRVPPSPNIHKLIIISICKTPSAGNHSEALETGTEPPSSAHSAASVYLGAALSTVVAQQPQVFS